MPRSTTPDLRKLNPTQLKDLIAKAQKRQRELSDRRIDRVRARVAALLKAEGLSFDEVFGNTRGPAKSKPGPKPGSKPNYVVKPKYRNPDDAAQTWSGRGKAPRWFAAALAAGKTAADLAIA